MLLNQILKLGVNELKNVTETPSLDAEILIGFVLGMTKADLIIHNNKEINSEAELKILNLLERRKNNEPIAYLINQKEFYGFNFYVDANVLIPRPETETLVEAVIQQVVSKTQNLDFQLPTLNSQPPTFIIDVGTGSGCIPISLASNLPQVQFVAIDVSEKALVVARKNVEKFGLSERIELRQGDLLTGMDACLYENTMMITANLPYIPEDDVLMLDVLNFEPHSALFAGIDGLDYYKKLLEQAVKFKPSGIFLEIDPRQVNKLKVISQKLFPDYLQSIQLDLAGKERIFILKKPL